MLQRFVILIISWDFWFFTRVTRKRERDARVSSHAGEGRFAVICFRLITS
jgi:hypothetical protein